MVHTYRKLYICYLTGNEDQVGKTQHVQLKVKVKLHSSFSLHHVDLACSVHVQDLIHITKYANNSENMFTHFDGLPI